MREDCISRLPIFKLIVYPAILLIVKRQTNKTAGFPELPATLHNLVHNFEWKHVFSMLDIFLTTGYN